MNLTLAELKDRIIKTRDPDELVDELAIPIEDLVECLEEWIEKKWYLFEDLEETFNDD